MQMKASKLGCKAEPTTGPQGRRASSQERITRQASTELFSSSALLLIHLPLLLSHIKVSFILKKQDLSS